MKNIVVRCENLWYIKIFLPEKIKKIRKTFFCRVCIFPQGPFFSIKMRKNILPCVHFPAGAFFWRKIRNNILPCVHFPAGAFFWRKMPKDILPCVHFPAVVFRKTKKIVVCAFSRSGLFKKKRFSVKMWNLNYRN